VFVRCIKSRAWCVFVQPEDEQESGAFTHQVRETWVYFYTTVFRRWHSKFKAISINYRCKYDVKNGLNTKFTN